MTIGALSGLTVAVTGERRSDEQCRLLQRRGATVVRAPVLASVACTDAEIGAAAAELLLRPPDVLVVCTAPGILGWIASEERRGRMGDVLASLASTHVIARGPKAVDAVHDVGLDVGWSAPEATYAAVVARLAAQRSTASDGTSLRLAVLVDGNGSRWLLEASRRLGYEVVPLRVYRWEFPEDLSAAERVVCSIARGGLDAVTFTSPPGVSRFFAISESCECSEQVRTVFNTGAVVVAAVGPVTAAALRDHGIRFAVEPTTPCLGSMVQALAGSLSTRTRA